MFYRSSCDAPVTFITFLTGKSLLSARSGETIEKASLKLHGMPANFEKYSISLVLLILAQLDDSNAEIVQIYRKSVLSKFLRCAVNIHYIFDREKLMNQSLFVH